MHRYVKKIITLCMAALLVLLAAGTAMAAMPPIMKLSEVRSGMQGTAYTVVDSSLGIQTFQVDIRGVMDNGKGQDSLILARAYGPVVENVGGILSGMSGSPVYVDGKLVGAISRTYVDTNPLTCMITPIEDMMKIWSFTDSKNKTQIRQTDVKKAAEERKKARAAINQELDKYNEKLKMEQRNSDKSQNKSMLYVSGFNAAGLDFLKKQLAPYGYGIEKLTDSPMTTQAVGTTRYNATLQPGGAVGAAVTYGDFTIGALGTVTAVDGNYMLAFGHQFTHWGNVNFFMTDANVIGTAAGPTDGRKVANFGDIIGRINQDRNAGIGGVLGRFPTTVPIHVTVRDEAIGETHEYHSMIAYDEELVPALGATLAYASMAKTMDRESASTAKLHFAIKTNVAEKGLISRENMFFGASDVGQTAVGELAQALNIICSNTEKESNVFDIKVDVTVKGGRRTASIISVTPDKTVAAPGEQVQLKVGIKPYRGTKEEYTIPYTIPKNQHSGQFRLDIRGGGLVPVTQTMIAQQSGIDTSLEEDKTETTESKLEKYVKRDKNNEIVITASLQQPAMTPSEAKRVLKETAKAVEEASAALASGKGSTSDKGSDSKTPYQSKLATEYVIDNVAHTMLQIVRK